MRTTHNRPPQRSNQSLPWKWIGVFVIIGFIFWFSSHFGKDTNTSHKSDIINVTLGTGSEVYMIDSKGIKEQMEKDFSLSNETSTISVANGNIEIRNQNLYGLVDKASELGYKKSTIDTLELLRGRTWIETQGSLQVHLKNIDITLKDKDIVFIEQNQVYSTLYVFQGNVQIQAGTMSYVVNAGKRIMVAHSDILNPSLSLESLSGPIDDSIKQNAFFLARNGESLLATAQNTTTQSGSSNGSGGIILNSGSTIGASGTISSLTKRIEITSPEDGSTVSTQTIKITGKILSSEVKKVTINELNAIVSPVDGTFIFNNFPITSDTTNIVYKAFSSDGNMLERGVISISSKDGKKGTEKLSPNTFPLNDKNYKIASPAENPYKTTESSVTVQGVVPKDTVSYIMVNNYRLKQYKAFSTTWYYYANMSYATMKDGINLYEIKFYGPNDELLSTQLFTIVKENKTSTTVSGETR